MQSGPSWSAQHLLKGARCRRSPQCTLRSAFGKPSSFANSALCACLPLTARSKSKQRLNVFLLTLASGIGGMAARSAGGSLGEWMRGPCGLFRPICPKTTQHIQIPKYIWFVHRVCMVCDPGFSAVWSVYASPRLYRSSSSWANLAMRMFIRLLRLLRANLSD